MQTLPAPWWDTTALGDLKTGIETLDTVDGNLAVALVWLAGIVASQSVRQAVFDLEGVEIDGIALGDWRVTTGVSAPQRMPDPAQERVLGRDGGEIAAVAEALEGHGSALDRARRVAAAGAIRHAHPNTSVHWTWVTPLGRRVAIVAERLT